MSNFNFEYQQAKVFTMNLGGNPIKEIVIWKKTKLVIDSMTVRYLKLD